MSGLRYETGRDMPPGMQELAADSLVKRLMEESKASPELPDDAQPVAGPLGEDRAKESETDRRREQLIDLLLEANKAAERMCQEHSCCDECHYRAPNGCTWGFIAERLIAAGVTTAKDMNTCEGERQ